jgi:predicted Fe-Mo cluster-binding NifX family protein
MGDAGLNEEVSQHFGRAVTFTSVDLDTGAVKVVPNQSEHMGGSGLPPEMMSKQDVQVLIAGGLGPKAIQAFAQLGITVFVGAAGTVREAIEDWKAELLECAGPENACQEHRH